MNQLTSTIAFIIASIFIFSCSQSWAEEPEKNQKTNIQLTVTLKDPKEGGILSIYGVPGSIINSKTFSVGDKDASFNVRDKQFFLGYRNAGEREKFSQCWNTLDSQNPLILDQSDFTNISTGEAVDSCPQLDAQSN